VEIVVTFGVFSAMKPPKNRKKAFRVHCPNCHASQDSLSFACVQCGKRLYSNMEADELQGVTDKVKVMEGLLDQMENPGKGNPYAPMDKAWETYRGLRSFTYLPGMPYYLDRVMEVLLPLKMRLLQRTVKANWVFLVVLGAFPLVTLAFGMHAMVTGFLALPALAWLLVTLRAARDLQKTKARLAQISPS
jgi:hypothetical protein